MTEDRASLIGRSDAREAHLRCQQAQNPQQVLDTWLLFVKHRAEAIGLSGDVIDRRAFNDPVAARNLSAQLGARVGRLLSLLGDHKRMWPEDVRAFAYWAMGLRTSEGIQPGFVQCVIEAYSDATTEQVLRRLVAERDRIVQKLNAEDMRLFRELLPRMSPMFRDHIASRVELCAMLQAPIQGEHGEMVSEDPEAYRVEMNNIRRLIRKRQRVEEDRREAQALLKGSRSVSFEELLGF